MPSIDPKILEQYVVTANSGKYKSWDEVNSKFPELKGYDPKLLEQYVVTANSGKYKSWDELNSKFPEFQQPQVKKKESTQGVSPLVASPSASASSGEIAGGFADVVKQTQPLQKPTVKKKEQPKIEQFMRGQDKLARTISSLDGVEAFNSALQRGLLSGERADLLNVSQGFSSANVERLAEINREMETFKSSPSYQKFNEAISESNGDKFFEAIKENPVGVFTELITESMTALVRHGYSRAAAGAVTGAAAGSVIPVIGTLSGAGAGLTAGMGLASTNLEYSGSIIEALQENGVDIKDADEIKKAFSSAKEMESIRESALKRGVPIGLFDMLSMGVAGKFVAKPTASVARKIAGQLAETGTQAAFGGAGEAAAQIVSGQELSPYAILSEMMAEPVTSAPEIAVGAMIRNKKAGQPINEEILANVVASPEVTPDVVSEMLDVSVGAGEITEQQKAEVMADIDAMASAFEAIPDEYADKRTKLAPIVLRKKGIDAQVANLEIRKSSVDESFHEAIDQQIAQLQQQKQDLDAQIKSAITPQAEATNVQLEMPSPEQILAEVSDGKVKTFEYERREDIPSEFVDKVTSFGENNGKKVFKVTMAESLANYYLSKANAQQPTTPQAEATTTQEAGTAEGAVGVADTEGGAGVSGVGIQEFAQEFLGGRVSEMTSNLESRMQAAEEIDMSEIDSVVEDLISINDSISKNNSLTESQKQTLSETIESKIDQLLNYEFATATETETVAERSATKSIITTPREGVRQTVNKERFDGAEVMSKGSKGKIERNGNFFDLVFGDNRISIDWNFIEFVESRLDNNGDLAVTLVDTRSGTEFMVMDNELALDVAISESQKQIGVVPEGEFDIVVREVVSESKKQTKRFVNPDKPKQNEKAKQEPKEGLLAGVRGNRPQDEGRKEGAQLRAEKEKVGGKDAAKKPSTEKVSVGEQPKVSEGVRGQDAKGQEASEKSEAKKRIEAAKEKRKEAIEKIKQQFRDAKNAGISFDFEKKMKEDKEFFGALRDIIRTNLEIGVLSFTENVADVASIIGQELDAKAKKALRKLYGQEAIAELKRTKKAELDLEDIRQAVTDYIEDNKKVLDEVANAKVTRLVNEVKTEGGVNQLIKYVEKLVESKEFRTQVKDAAKGLDAAISKLKGVAGGEQIISLIESIRVAGVDKVELLTKMANLLNVDPTTPKRIEQVRKDASELLNEVNDFFSKKAQDSMPKTFAEMEKAMDDSLTERVLNEEKGEYEKKPKKFDSARKIRNFVNKIGDFKEQVLMLQGLGVITDAEAAVLVERIDNMQGMADEAVTNLKEKIAEETTAATMQARKIVSNFKDDGSVGYSTLIKPLKEALANIKDLSFSQAVRLQRFLEDAQNGYYALSAYRDIVSPIIDKPKADAAKEFVGKASKVRQGKSGTFTERWRSRIPKEMMEYGRSPESVKRKSETTWAQYMDDIFGDAAESIWLRKILNPIIKTTKVYEDAVKSFNREYNKLTTGSQLGRILGKDALFRTMPEYKKSMTRVGYYMAARRYPNRNILQEQAQLLKEGARGLSESQKNILNELNKKYPDGKVPESELTAKEKKVVAALDTLYAKLAKYQAQVNLMRGQDFQESAAYYPFLFLGASPIGKQQIGLHNSEQESYTDTNEAIATQRDSKKNPKVRSDRGLQANPESAPFLINPNADMVFRAAVSDVFKDRFLFPEVYGVTKGFNQAKEVDGDFAEMGMDRYRDMIRSYVSTAGYKFIEAPISAKQVEILTRFDRYIAEPMAGFWMYGVVPGLKFRRMTRDLAQALVLTANGGYEKLLELGDSGRYQRVEEFEELSIDAYVDKGKDIISYITSPDALNDSTYRRAAFVATMKNKFKEITGKDINLLAAAKSKEYIAENKEALQKASDEAYSMIYGKYYPKNGKLTMPTKVMRVRLGGLLGKNGFVLDRTRSDFEATTAKMMFLFGTWGFRTGQLFSIRQADFLLGTNHGRATAAKSLASMLVSVGSYQYIKQSVVIAGSFKALSVLLQYTDDEEEMTRMLASFNRMFSTQFTIGQLLSTFIYLKTARWGAIGKAGTLLAGYALDKQIEKTMTNSGSDVAELKRTQDAVRNAVRDIIFKNMPTNEKDLEEALITTTAGGYPLFMESLSEFTGSVSEFASDPISNKGIDELMYALGTAYNAVLAQKTRLPIPFLGTLKNEKIDEMENKDMSLEQIKRKIAKDERYSEKVFEDLAYEAAWKSKKEGMDKGFMLKKIDEGEEGKVSPLVEAYEKALKAFPKDAETEKGKKEIADKLTKQFEKMLYPASFIKMKNIPDPKLRGYTIAEEHMRIIARLDEDISEDTRQRLEFELDLISDLVDKSKSKEFKDAYDERTRTK